MKWWEYILEWLMRHPSVARQILLEPVQHSYTPPPTIPQKPLEPAGLILARQAEAWLGRDPSTPDKADDELGCADSVSAVVRTVYKNFPHTISTVTLYENLKRSPHFKGTLTPSKGCVVVSPRKGTQAGHTGIFLTDTKIASNDSRNGLWLQNYTWASWIQSFKNKKKLRIHLFEPK